MVFILEEKIIFRGTPVEIRTFDGTRIFLQFQYCQDKTISLYKVAPACVLKNCELTLK